MTRHIDTDVLHVGEGARDDAAPLTTPIYTSTTYRFESAQELEEYQQGRNSKLLYSRHENPSVQAVEAKLAALEGAEAAMLAASGMAATSAVFLSLLSPGDELVCSASVYGGTTALINKFLSRFRIDVRFAALDAFDNPAGLIGDRTRMVWFESPANPTLRCIDIRRVAEACRARQVMSVIDSTFASPVNQQPLALGVDLVMHSATKYLNGHSDVIAGVVAGPAALIDRLQPARRFLGATLDSRAAYEVGRGLKTLAVRVPRQNDTAMKVAEWLERDARVAHVYYPGLASHPDHDVARAQMRGFGGMVTFEAAGGYQAARGLFDRLGVFARAASLGGVESLCSLPVLTSHHGLTDAQLREAGVAKGLVRLSMGLEHAGDLIADLDQALG